MSLFDLWNFTEEERNAAQSGQKLKSAKGGKKAKSKPVQRSLFDMPAIPKEEPKKVEEVKPAVQEPKEEPKAEATSSTADPDDIYASINWEDNPPINGFYEMMMDLTPEQRKALREKAHARWEAEKQQAEAPSVEAKAEVPTPTEKVTNEVTERI